MTSTIRFKFRAELNFSNLSFDGHYITVGELKRLIAEKKGLGIDAINELQLTDATAKRDLDNDNEQVMKNSAVLVKRVTGAARPKTIVSSAAVAAAAAAAVPPVAHAAAAGFAGDLGHAAPVVDDEFGEDPLAAKPAAVSRDELAFLEQARQGVNLESQLAQQNTVMGRGARGRGRGFGPGGRGRGRDPNLLCNRCGQPGHFVSECPTQGDPAYDRRYKVAVGIPQSKIQRNADGSLYLPDGELGELAANTQAFNRLAALMGRLPNQQAPQQEGQGVAGGQQDHGASTSAAPSWRQVGQAAADAKAAATVAASQPQHAAASTSAGAAALEAIKAEPAAVKAEALQPPPSPKPAAAGADAAQAAAASKATPEAQLFDDDLDHKPAINPATLNLALGMGSEGPGRRSTSPAPSVLTGRAGAVAGGPAASAGGQGRGASGEDGDGVPASLRGVGCSERQLMEALPFLRGLLPGDMAMADVFRWVRAAVVVRCGVISAKE